MAKGAVRSRKKIVSKGINPMAIKEIFCKSLWIQLLLLSVIGLIVYNAFVYTEDAKEWYQRFLEEF